MDGNIEKLKTLPQIGKFYHFWDDGKISTSRHYICKCERIVTPNEAKKIIVSIPEWDYKENKNNFIDISLYDHWKNDEMLNHKWLYSEDTDYFIECSCPRYDDNNIWFVRTKDGGWFSINIQSSWQGGRLDIDGSIYERIVKECQEEGLDISGYEEAKYKKD